MVIKPNGLWLAFASAPDATSVRAKIDESLGYPKHGINVGGGVHAPPEQSVTVHAVDVAEKKDGTAAVFVDAEADAIVRALKAAAEKRVTEAKAEPQDAVLVAVATPSTLDASWLEASPVNLNPNIKPVEIVFDPASPVVEEP